MNTCRLNLLTRTAIAMIGAASLMIISSCGDQSVSPQGSTTNSTTLAKGAEVNTLPIKGKLAASVAPQKAVFGMIWVNTAENREYIFDGVQFVPHDNTVEVFYKAIELKEKKSAKTVAMVQTDVCDDGDPSCTPTASHGASGHNTAAGCQLCHKVGGRLSFSKATAPTAWSTAALADPTNPNKKPYFDATTKTCSNISCHGVPQGTYSYYFSSDGNDDPILYQVSYGGAASGSGNSPNWVNITGGSCTACHDNPPRNFSWHSGWHANKPPSDPMNQCQFCHPDAIGSNNQATGLNSDPLKAQLHGNGIIDVAAAFKSTCFYCH